MLSAIAVALGRIPTLLPGVSGIDFRKTDPRSPSRPLRVAVTTTDGMEWERLTQAGPRTRRRLSTGVMETIEAIVNSDREQGEPLDLPIVVFYGTERSVSDNLRGGLASAKISPASPPWKGRFPPVPTSGISPSGSTHGKTKS